MGTNPKQPKRDHQARVNVDDATWREFRQRAPGPVAAVLGEMVEREVRRFRRQDAREGTRDERRLPELIEEARELKAELDQVVTRMEAHRVAPPRPRPGVVRW